MPEESQDGRGQVPDGALSVVTRLDSRAGEPSKAVRSVTAGAAERVRPDHAHFRVQDGIQAGRPADDQIRVRASGGEWVIACPKDVLDGSRSGPCVP